MVVVREGEPLRFHKRGSLAQVVVGITRGRRRLHGHVAVRPLDRLGHIRLRVIGQGQDLLEGVVRGHGRLQDSLVIEHRHSQGHFVILNSFEEVFAGTVADVGWELEAGVQKCVGVVAHQHGIPVVGLAVAIRSRPGSRKLAAASGHGIHGDHGKRHIEGHLFHHGATAHAVESVVHSLGPRVLQIVHGIAVDVIHQVGRHHRLEQVPLVAKVLAPADGHVPARHLESLRLELVEPAALDGNRVHLHEEEGVVHVHELTLKHGRHDLREDRIGTRDPVLVRGVATVVVHVLLWVQHGRHVLDAGEAICPALFRANAAP